MASIGSRLSNAFGQLRWRLTLSYTAVTVGALLAVVLVLGVMPFSRILVPHNAPTAEVWIYLVSEKGSVGVELLQTGLASNAWWPAERSPSWP